MIRYVCAAVLFGILAAGAVYADEPAGTETPADIQELIGQLTAGDPDERLAALRKVGPHLKQHADLLLPAMIECAKESEPPLRAAAINIVGQQLIWVDGPQNSKAIEFALEMSREANPDVRHACVYFCLTTVREKSEPVIDRLIELVCEYEPTFQREFKRVEGSLQGQQQLAAQRIQAYLDRQDDKAELPPVIATELYRKLTGAVPDRIERFAERGEFFAVVGLTLPFQPKSREEVVEILRKQIGGDLDAFDIRGGVERQDAAALILVKGLGPWTRLLTIIDSTEGFKTVEALPPTIITPEMRPKVEMLLKRAAESQDIPPSTTSYEAAFKELYDKLGREYPSFALKQIDWQQAGAQLLTQSRTPMSVNEFSLLCQRLVAKLEDSHAFVGKGTAQPASMPMPRWDPGFACLIDQTDRPVIFTVQPDSPAAKAGLRPGMAIVSINGTPAAAAMDAYRDTVREYYGYSSDRLLRHDAAREFHRQRRRGAILKLEIDGVDGKRESIEVAAALAAGYVPRLPVPIDGIQDTANLSFKRLDQQIGYIYVRRISQNLIESLDRAVGELHDCQGLIVDVRGNSGGGFDAQRALRNFDPDDQAERERPRFAGPVAVLIDSRCISAGEGWSSWFKAKNRGKFFGETTAGASGRKTTIPVAGGLFQVTYPIKAYTGFLDRPIERLGIDPDVPVRPSAKDLSQGIDTVLETARRSLVDLSSHNGAARP